MGLGLSLSTDAPPKRGGGGGGGPWSPSAPDGEMRQWVSRASSKFQDTGRTTPATTGTMCASWTDVGPGARHPSQATGANRGTVHASGGITFAGTHWLQHAGIGAWAGDFLVLTIAKLTANATYSRYASVDFATGWNLMNGPATHDIYSGCGVAGPPYADLLTTALSGNVHTFLDYRVGTTHSLSIDGAAPVTATVTGAALADTTFFIGSDGGPFGMNGVFYEQFVIKNPSPADIVGSAAYAATSLAGGGF